MSDSSRIFSSFFQQLSRRIHWRNFIRQALSLALVLSLAFPQTVWADTFSTLNTFSLTSIWAQIKGATSDKDPGLMDPLERAMPADAPIVKSKSKDELKSKVGKLESSLPNKIELQTREKMNFFAVPVDSQKKALHGLEVEYQSLNPEIVFINKQGEAMGGKPGTTEVLISSGAQQLRYQVTVVAPPKRPRKEAQKIGSNSGKAKIYKIGASFSNTRKIVRTYAKRNYAKTANAAVQYGTPPPQGNHAPYAIGTPPRKTESGAPNPPAAMDGTERPGSANYSFTTPLFSLSGRGPDAALDLYYNSRLWNYNGSAYFFDEDKNWIAPGFSLGYGKLKFRELGVAGGGAGFLEIEYITSNGTHHTFGETSTGVWETGDGTFMKFVENSPNQWMRPYSSLGTLYLPNGVSMEIGSGVQTYYSTGYQNYYRLLEAFPKKITDRNGNYIHINYLSSAGPKIDTIVDSMNRYVRFYYDSYGSLFEITTPGYANASERSAVRIFYQDITINPSFSNWNGSEAPTPSTRRAIRYIHYPGTAIAYKYDYSSYGMIYKTTKLGGFVIYPEAVIGNPNATIDWEGEAAATTTYNYPITPSNLSDIPEFTTRTDDWSGNTTGGPVVTSFSDDPALGTSTVTAPDGTQTITSKITGTGSSGGQVSQTELKKNGVLFGKSVIEYDPNNATQIKKITTTNDKNQSKSVEYTYTTYNNVSVAVEKDFSGVEVRRTETLYETGSGWINRRFLSLPKSVIVKDAAATVVSRMEYTYDNSDTGVNGNNLLSRGDAVAGFDPVFNPYAPATSVFECVIDYNDPDWQYPGCYYNYDPNCDGNYIICDWVNYPSPYVSANAYRGNVTKAIQYAKPANQAEANIKTFKYDVLGNVTEESASCCRQRAYTYTVDNHYAYPASVVRGAVGGTQLTSTSTYDFNTGLLRESRDENNQLTTYQYFADSLRASSVLYPDGGKRTINYYDYLYADPDPDPAKKHSYILTQTWTTTSGNARQSFQYFDGAGHVVRTFGDHLADGRSITDLEYDNMGRVKKQKNPYYGTSGRNTPLANVSSTENQYDELGRVTSVKFNDIATGQSTLAQIEFDGSATQNYYIETVTDQAQKKRRRMTDALGRLIEVHEPDASGSLGTVTAPAQKTTYQYDTLDNVVKITQGNLMPELQQRFFKYDGLSRLTHERQVEQSAPHAETDVLTGNNSWSKKIIYDSDGKVTDSYDARNTQTHFTYDTLNRVTGISYSGGSPTVATPSVTYTYDEPETNYFNQGRLTEAKTAALGAIPETKIQYDYDLMGRVKQHKQFIGTTSYTMGYGYNVAGQLTQQTYPSGRVINYTNTNGILTGVNGVYNSNTTTYASGLHYTPHGAMDSETLGNGAIHTMNFNNRLQLNQINLTKNGVELQRYDYGYGQYDATNTTLDATKNNGQIAKISGFIGGAKQWEQRHTYDSLGRLSVAGEYRGDNNLVSWRTHYDYDRFGNRRQGPGQTQNSGLAFTQVVENDIDVATNRFKPTTGITYDAGGNITADNKFKPVGTTYNYDANNRVVATNNSAAVYDSLGQRLQETAAGITTNSIYDIQGSLVAEYSGAVIREYIYRGSDAIATIESSTFRYLMSNHLGSNSTVMNDTGGVVVRHDYLPFGEEVNANIGMRNTGQGYGATDLTRTKFAGMERSIGLDHTLFRKMETKAGRWNRPDPYLRSIKFGNPQSNNRYSYVGNDPINAFDPIGLDSVTICRDITTPVSHYQRINGGSWNYIGTSFIYSSSCMTIGAGSRDRQTTQSAVSDSKKRKRSEEAIRVGVYNRCMRQKAAEKKDLLSKLNAQMADAVVENAMEDGVYGAIIVGGFGVIGGVAWGELFGGGTPLISVPAGITGGIAGAVVGGTVGFVEGGLTELGRQLLYKSRAARKKIEDEFSFKNNQSECKKIAGL